jgi:hypothetical protein
MDLQHVRTASAARAKAPAVWFACLTIAAVVVFLAVVPAARAASGDLAWRRQIVGPSNGAASFTAAAPAPKGGVFAAGWIFNATGDFLAARYAGTGRRSWLRSLDFSLHAYDAVGAATSDSHGDLIVAGEVDYPSLSQAEAIVKYGPGGKRLWIRYFRDSVAGQATWLATDARGDIYVTSRTSTNEIAVIKYSPSGARRWVRRYSGGPGDTQPRGIALDAAGNVYVAGFSFSTVSNYDIVTLKYDPAGHRRWIRRWDGPASGDDLGYGIAVTPAGGLYVAGQSTGIATGADAVVLKYSTGGALLWVRSYSSAGAFNDWFNAVALLRNGDVAAAGLTSPDSVQQNVLAVRLSSTGHTRWRKSYDGPDGLSDQGSFVAGGLGRSVYVAGTSDSATTGTDMLTLKYGVAGNLSWAQRYAGAGTSNDYANGLVVTGGGVYVAGDESSNTSTIATLLKYKP